MNWIKLTEKKPPLYKDVLLLLSNKVIVNGYFSEAGPCLDRHILIKRYAQYEPEEARVIYWCDEMPKFQNE